MAETQAQAVTRAFPTMQTTPLPATDALESAATSSSGTARSQAAWGLSGPDARSRGLHGSPFERGEHGATIALPFDRLACFADVADTFADLGVRFNNAISLIPSNPSYPAGDSSRVIVSAPQNGALEIYFDRPIAYLTAWVTSSRAMTMSAKDDTGAIVARSGLACGNLHGSDSPLPANHPATVMAPAIHSVMFSAFDGQIALRDVSFAFASAAPDA